MSDKCLIVSDKTSNECLIMSDKGNKTSDNGLIMSNNSVKKFMNVLNVLKNLIIGKLNGLMKKNVITKLIINYYLKKKKNKKMN
jgi:hypothetical protein